MKLISIAAAIGAVIVLGSPAANAGDARPVPHGGHRITDVGQMQIALNALKSAKQELGHADPKPEIKLAVIHMSAATASFHGYRQDAINAADAALHDLQPGGSGTGAAYRNLVAALKYTSAAINNQ